MGLFINYPPYWQEFNFGLKMGISRDSYHKRRSTGGKMKPLTKKRKHCLGRPAAMTKIGPKRIRTVRCRGGNIKFRALRLESGNFSWGSESITRKTRVLDVVYNASNNELVRTKTLVKNAIVQIDGSPFKQWFEAHYGVALGRKRDTKCLKVKKIHLPSQDPNMYNAQSMPENQAAKLNNTWKNNSPVDASMLASHHVQDNLVDVTDTSSREKNLTSTLEN